MLKSRIEAKDPERSELEAAMAEFLSNGGEIDVIDRPVSVKSTQKDVNDAAEIEAYKNKKSRLDAAEEDPQPRVCTARLQSQR